MTKEEVLLRSILGPSRKGVNALAYAVAEMERLLFMEQRSIDDVLVTKDIYPVVTKQTGKRSEAAARQIERMGESLLGYNG